jgi:hypothetical protein
MKSAHAILPPALLLGALLSVSCSKEAPGSSHPSGKTDIVKNQAMVSFASGEVTAESGTQKTTVRIGDILAKGQTLKTAAQSECELRLGTSATIRIEENTEVVLNDIVLNPGRISVELGPVLGAVRCKVGRLSGDERFRVRTPTAVVGVRGTEFRVAVSAGGNTLLAVQQGNVAILPASIDLEELAAELKTDDPEVSAAFAELGKAELIVQDGQKVVVTVTAFRKAEESRHRVEKAIEVISGKKQPTAAEKKAFLAAMRKAAAEIRASMAAPTPATVQQGQAQGTKQNRGLEPPPKHDATNPIPVEILNNSFENPSAKSGEGVATDDWVCGGIWFGRWSIAGAAKDGSGFVWASFRTGGPGNGYSQELSSRYVVGHYRLSVWINSDARGLGSRAALGYDSGNDKYQPIAEASMDAPYGLATSTAWADSWVQQTLDVDVQEGDPAVGKPIWMRFTNTTSPAPKQQSDLDNYGDSVSWDHVSLTRFNYVEGGE